MTIINDIVCLCSEADRLHVGPPREQGSPNGEHGSRMKANGEECRPRLGVKRKREFRPHRHRSWDGMADSGVEVAFHESYRSLVLPCGRPEQWFWQEGA